MNTALNASFILVMSSFFNRKLRKVKAANDAKNNLPTLSESLAPTALRSTGIFVPGRRTPCCGHVVLFAHLSHEIINCIRYYSPSATVKQEDFYNIFCYNKKATT